MNVFPDVDLMARRQPLIDDDIPQDVEALEASLKSEAVDVSPPVGLDRQGYLGQHHDFIALGSWNVVDQAGAQSASRMGAVRAARSRRDAKLQGVRRSGLRIRVFSPGANQPPQLPHFFWKEF
jgi:hypothetical protein